MAEPGIRVEVILAYPRRHAAQALVLPEGARVADALAACDLPLAGVVAYAVFGERVPVDAALADGDRLELLRPLARDPKDARRRRAGPGRG